MKCRFVFTVVHEVDLDPTNYDGDVVESERAFLLDENYAIEAVQWALLDEAHITATVTEAS